MSRSSRANALALIAMCGCCLSPRSATAEVLPRLYEAGTFHGDEVSLVTGDLVIGLYRKEQAFELREVVVTITPVRDEIVDSEEERTGKRLDVPDAENALLLLPKSIGLSAGPVAGVAPNSEEISIGGTIEVSNDRRLLVTGRAAIEEGLELSDVSLWLACEGSNSVESYLELLKFETLDSSG
ncbi:MAG: hypothetical protein IT290_03870, partial [Deltaproteobacteria bacterium]|nr:hypothetical protein [Deltaproteobacteria bacterium]